MTRLNAHIADGCSVHRNAFSDDMPDLADLETPRLLIDFDRLGHNVDTMRDRCRSLGVVLRPHLKTTKSRGLAQIATGGADPIAVSVLTEADYYAHQGYRDILYETTLVPRRLGHIDRIQLETGSCVVSVVDQVAIAQAVVRAAEASATSFSCMIEIDSGDRRTGVDPDSCALLSIADVLAAARNVELCGVLTRAERSHRVTGPDELIALAEVERSSVVAAAARLQQAGLPCPIVRLGSTPTIWFAKHLDGVTEVRCGSYLLWDLAQYARHLCDWDEIAVSVLATVIGHNRRDLTVILDAGALSLPESLGADPARSALGYGPVCDARTLQQIGHLSVEAVDQERGIVPVPDASWFLRLPIGSLVRIIPTNAFLACGADEAFSPVGPAVVTKQ